ncbi:MAG: murein hydrolase activator EnvC [Vicinamibacterales bacterium]
MSRLRDTSGQPAGAATGFLHGFPIMMVNAPSLPSERMLEIVTANTWMVVHRDHVLTDLVAATLVAVVATGASLVLAQAPQTDERTELARRAAERIRALQQEADGLASRARTVLGELRKLEIDRQIQAEQVAGVELELATVTAALDATTARVAALEAQRVSGTPGLENRLVAIYKRGRGGYARLLFEAADVKGFARVSRGVAAVARIDTLRIDAHRRTVRAEREALAELERRRAAVSKTQAQAVEARSALDQAMTSRNRLIDELDRRRDLAAQYVGELEAAQTEMARTVATLGAERHAPALPLTPFRGDLAWPIKGELVSRFGPTAAGRSGAPIVRNGIEVSASAGAEARAIHEGTVGFAAPFPGFATLVIVDHGRGAYSLYGHLASARVSPGLRVRRGEVVGEVGTTPRGVPALYFELRIDGRPVDPLQWLRSAP